MGRPGLFSLCSFGERWSDGVLGSCVFRPSASLLLNSSFLLNRSMVLLTRSQCVFVGSFGNLFLHCDYCCKWTAAKVY